MHLKTPNPNARPVVEGKRERDLASLEGEMSALMLSTYGNLRRTSLLFVVTKSEWRISKKMYGWSEREEWWEEAIVGFWLGRQQAWDQQKKSHREKNQVGQVDGWKQLNWSRPITFQVPHHACRYIDYSRAKNWHWHPSQWQQKERRRRQVKQIKCSKNSRLKVECRQRIDEVCQS